jgi:excisionase family DNA binding protein
MDLPELLTRPQAAAFLGVKPQTLSVWATTKRYGLPFIKVGSLVRYRRSDLQRFLDQRTIGGADEADRPRNHE